MQKQKIKVNTDTLKGKVTQNYVCWVDVMGIRPTMEESFEKAANFILRFHSCCISSCQREGITLYPLMDGAFITADNLVLLKSSLNSLFESLSSVFLEEDMFNRQFIVRGAVAYGESVCGEQITKAVCPLIVANDAYKKSLLFGMPMIQAYSCEHMAPPFGVYIHESARKTGELQGRIYRWWSKDTTAETLKEKVVEYFEWCRDNSITLEMDENKIDKYIKLTQEGFSKRDTTRKTNI